MKRSLYIFFLLSAMVSFFLLTGCTGTNSPGTSKYQFKSSELEKYTIIFEENNPDYFDLANQLADCISEKYGKALKILPDVITSPTQYEIILGDTNRCDRQGDVMAYCVTVEDGKFYIRVGGSFSAEKAIAFLCENVFNGQALNLDNGVYYQQSLLTQSCPITAGTTARIMSANILADAFADSSWKTAHYRAEIFAGMLVTYTPDVLGLQETDESWSEVLDHYLTKIQKTHGITYTRLLATYDNQVNYTSLLYRSDKFVAQDSGVNVFSWWADPAFNHNYHMRNISWAIFVSVENTDNKFIVANTHWSYRTEHADGSKYLSGSVNPIATDELRQQCKDETNAFLSALKQNHPSAPIVLTGDFNTSLSLFTQYGWTPTSFRIISEEAKSNGTAFSSVPVSGHFDHLFGTGEYTINRYAIIADTDFLNILTDHPFVYADFTF